MPHFSTPRDFGFVSRCEARCFVWALPLGFLFFALVSTGSAQQPSDQEDEKQAHAWFDTAGFPDLGKCPLVLVATGGKYKSGDGPWRNSYIHGFLVSDDGKKFQVFTTDLDTKSFEKSHPNTPEVDRVAYEKLDLKKAVAAHSRHVANRSDADEEARPVDLGYKEGLFIVAHACVKQGYPEEARLLDQLVHTQRQQAWNYKTRKSGGPISFRRDLIDALAERLTHQAISSLSGHNPSRKESLSQFERIIKHFPQVEEDDAKDGAERFKLTIGRHVTVAQAYADVLTKMVAEDEARRAKPPKPEKNMTREERIVELIYRLRDQNGFQSFDGIFSNIFHDKRSPAYQLATIGYPAVPQLIEAINDSRFSGSSCSPNRHEPNQRLRVGDCALLVIGRIAGREFYDSYRSIHHEGQVDVVKPAVKEWWADYQKHGEKKMLVDGAKAGTRDSIEQGRRLVERHPGAALEALAEGAEKATDEWVGAELVRLTAGLKNQDVSAVLRRQLKATSTEARLAAAIALRARGDDSGVDAMITTWRELRVDDDLWIWMSNLPQFLAGSNRPEAVKALGDGLEHRPPHLRVKVIDALYQCRDASGKEGAAARLLTIRDEILVRMLDDATPVGDNTRVCDHAAHRLTGFWTIPFAFDLTSDVRTRDRNLVELKNVWRKKQGLTLLPVPTAPARIEKLPDEKVRPKLQSFLDAANTAERREKWESIQAMGLPALSAVRETLAQLKPNHPAYADLKYFTTKLACTVNEINMGTGSVTPGKDLKQRIDRLKGQPLTADAIVALAISITRSLPEGVAGIDFTIERCDDNTGVSVTLILVRNELPAGATPTGWRTHDSIRVGRENTHGGSGSSTLEHGTTDARWDSYRRGLQKAFDASPEKTVTARARMVLEE